MVTSRIHPGEASQSALGRPSGSTSGLRIDGSQRSVGRHDFVTHPSPSKDLGLIDHRDGEDEVHVGCGLPWSWWRQRGWTPCCLVCYGKGCYRSWMIFSLRRKNQAAYYMSIFGLGTPTRSRSHVQAGSGEHVNAGLLCQQQPRPGESLVRNVVQVWPWKTINCDMTLSTTQVCCGWICWIEWGDTILSLSHFKL